MLDEKLFEQWSTTDLENPSCVFLVVSQRKYNCRNIKYEKSEKWTFWKALEKLTFFTFFEMKFHPSIDSLIYWLAQLICKMTSSVEVCISRIVDNIWASVILYGTTNGCFIVITKCFALLKGNIPSITRCSRACIRVHTNTTTSLVGSYKPIPIHIYESMIK